MLIKGMKSKAIIIMLQNLDLTDQHVGPINDRTVLAEQLEPVGALTSLIYGSENKVVGGLPGSSISLTWLSCVEFTLC